jgi:hypothetical protein
MLRQETVQKALSAIKRVADHDYFFNQLSSPAWIEPLWNAGLFRDPPPPIREGDYIQYPGWAESRYLLRMAQHSPREVLNVVLKIPTTENVRVHEDIVEIASAMPPDLAVKLVPTINTYLESPHQLLLPEKISRLVTYLADAGKSRDALTLARSLLMVKSDAQTEEKGGNTPRQPKGRIDDWHYEQVLRSILPAITHTAPLDTVRLFSSLLYEAVRLSLRRHTDVGDDDYSFIWRPAVEDHVQNLDTDIRSLLVEALRNTSELVIRRDPHSLSNVISLLGEYAPRVFQRIILHLLRVFGHLSPPQVEQTLTSDYFFSEIGLRHEYALLLGDFFAHLESSSQLRILEMIEQESKSSRIQVTPGPDGEAPSRELIDARSKYSLLDRMKPIRDVLPTEWESLYRRLVEEIGEPEHPEFPFFMSGGFMGPTSPKSASELSSMPPASLIEYLKTWRPTEEFMSPSGEGLARALQEATAENPTRFGVLADDFAELAPWYARGLLDGLGDAVKQGHSLPWEQVLALCLKVALSVDDPSCANDENWRWTRGSIADLLEDAVQRESSALHLETRDRVWSILELLMKDPDPSPEHEIQFGGSNMDPSTMALNSVRGKALHSVIRYAFWVKREVTKLTASDEITEWFEKVPEVRSLLDAHLKSEIDASLAVRAVYGQWFPTLHTFDRTWSKENIPLIFPADRDAEALRDAAWEAYVGFWAPFDSVFDALRTEYGRAVDRIGSVDPEKRHVADPDERLAEHLIVLYGRGRIELEDPLIQGLFSRSSPKQRGQCLEFVGRVLRNENQVITPELLDRLTALWLWRVNVAEDQGAEESSAAELKSFGWWFASGRFDDEWALAQLQNALTRLPETDAINLVLERLSATSSKKPTSTMTCLRLLALGVKERWQLDVWREHVRTILKLVLGSGDQLAYEMALRFIHEMGAHGIDSYRDLLPDTAANR